ncbi:orotidine-5'-phosphate decarboxylase [Sphingobacterium corticibacter]|uniref:Orotidine-5'-phosphate decarboxylase n=1 Tax=Sphingobacterium corticibacter TaxID=2171749 RepID=A0A2T8HN26_9SPHI|nr:orotidine-5'-phosphate decarboxylase [Sphingobacterium corticibacter]PVH26702.1 orotidine-5'-phosphate decarboxylase [Sphingobacterium corticibacter]
MNRDQLFQEIVSKKSFLCVGLDTDLTKIPEHLLGEEDPIFAFNKEIVAATEDLCVAYKPNIAFYECYGTKGWESLRKTCEILPKNTLRIADAKRGDIGNTSKMYAQAFFDPAVSGLDFDAITIAPYMGEDSVTPFLEFENKWAIVLALTSNAGSKNFQNFANRGDKQLFEEVIDQVNTWGSTDNLMYVVGATRGEAFLNIRAHAPDHFLLVPGVGAQGGSLEDVCKYGMNAQCGLLVNSTRAIIYASSGRDFAEKAREEAIKVQKQMEAELIRKGIL